MRVPPSLLLFFLTASLAPAQITYVSSGGTFRTNDTNLSIGGTAFASSLINGDGHGVHSIEALNNGSYGNSSSWIGDSTNAAGILFSSGTNIGSFAFGRDNTGVFSDRYAGSYYLSYTTDTGLNAGNAFGANWTEIGRLDYSALSPVNPARRHLYNLNSLLSNVTGFRIDAASGTAIDELEIYASAAAIPGRVSTYQSTFTGIGAFGPGQTLATRFTTNGSASQFSLSNIIFDTITGTTGISDFTVQVRADTDSLPGAVLGTLSGTAAPSGFASHTFTASGLLLDANTSYWLTLGFTTPGGVANFSMTNNPIVDGTWGIDTNQRTFYSTSTNAWYQLPEDALRVTIEAEPLAIPEPSTYAALFAAAALGLAAWRSRTARAA